MALIPSLLIGWGEFVFNIFTSSIQFPAIQALAFELHVKKRNNRANKLIVPEPIDLTRIIINLQNVPARNRRDVAMGCRGKSDIR